MKTPILILVMKCDILCVEPWPYINTCHAVENLKRDCPITCFDSDVPAEYPAHGVGGGAAVGGCVDVVTVVARVERVEHERPVVEHLDQLGNTHDGLAVTRDPGNGGRRSPGRRAVYSRARLVGEVHP